MSSSSQRSRRRNANEAALESGRQFIQNTRRRVANGFQQNPASFQSPPTTSRTRSTSSSRTRNRLNTQPLSQAVTPSPNGTLTNNEPGSIRSNARLPSRSGGINSGRSYHVGYNRFQNGRRSHTDSTRICYCDQPPCPPSCIHSQSFIPQGAATNTNHCPDHALVSCQHEGCNKVFHVECIRMLTRCDSFQSTDAFMCCLHKHAKLWDDFSGENISCIEECKRYGIDTGNAPPTSIRSLEKKIRTVKETLLQCNVPPSTLDEIRCAPSLPFPSIVHMDSDMAAKESECGRRFELSMLMFKVDTCSCCGITQPHHIDPFYPKESPLPKYHLNAKYYDAWECNCIESCHGQQFYGVKRPTLMAAFKSLHNNLTPDVFICGVAGAPPNAKLCQDCYFEYQTRDDGDICDGKMHNWNVLS
jgi:hypothetical protein